jgi:hypothetical protein
MDNKQEMVSKLLAALKQCLPHVDAHRHASGGDGDLTAVMARNLIEEVEKATGKEKNKTLRFKCPECGCDRLEMVYRSFTRQVCREFSVIELSEERLDLEPVDMTETTDLEAFLRAQCDSCGHVATETYDDIKNADGVTIEEG